MTKSCKSEPPEDLVIYIYTSITRKSKIFCTECPMINIRAESVLKSQKKIKSTTVCFVLTTHQVLNLQKI